MHPGIQRPRDFTCSLDDDSPGLVATFAIAQGPCLLDAWIVNTGDRWVPRHDTDILASGEPLVNASCRRRDFRSRQNAITGVGDVVDADETHGVIGSLAPLPRTARLIVSLQ